MNLGMLFDLRKGVNALADDGAGVQVAADIVGTAEAETTAFQLGDGGFLRQTDQVRHLDISHAGPGADSDIHGGAGAELLIGNGTGADHIVLGHRVRHGVFNIHQEARLLQEIASLPVVHVDHIGHGIENHAGADRKLHLDAVGGDHHAAARVRILAQHKAALGVGVDHIDTLKR